MNYLLEKGEVLTLMTTAAMEGISVSSGQVWLTKYDDQSDYCVGAGSIFSIRQAGKVVIEALEGASVSVVWQQVPATLRVAVVAAQAT